jgi:hypothetical protein
MPLDRPSRSTCPRLTWPVDPWLLGYWLGDGNRAAAMVATADAEVLRRIRALG